jgi:mevalonate kinase
MKWEKFKTNLPGKWVLVGEHTVMRDGIAIVFPYSEVRLRLDFVPEKTKKLLVSPAEAEPVISELLHRYKCEMGNGDFRWPTGRLRIRSSIPQGAGLGSSAALCASVAQWISGAAGIAQTESAELARRLESRFHGASSGMDIAAVMANSPILFEKGSSPRTLKLGKIPSFTLHDTGLRSSTAACISRVSEFIMRNPLKSVSIDRAMDAAAYKALSGLLAYGRGDDRAGLEAIADGMRMALDCFSASSWNLLQAAEERLINSLLAQGALAAKPTGSGGGGLVLALWECQDRSSCQLGNSDSKL